MTPKLRSIPAVAPVAMSALFVLMTTANTQAMTANTVWEDQFNSINPSWVIPAGMTMTSQANVTAEDGFEAKVTNTTGFIEYNILNAAPSYFIQPGDTLEFAVRTDPLVDIAADYLELIALDGTSAAVSPFTVHDSGSSYTVVQIPVTKDVIGSNNIWLGNNGFSGAGNDSTFYIDYIKVLRDDPVFASNVVAFDDFQRTASASLGTTSFGGFLWAETEGNPVQINGQASISLVNWTDQEQVLAGVPSIAGAQINSRGSGTDPTAIIDVGLADVAVTATLRSSLAAAGNNFFGGIRYRLPTISAGHASDVSQGYTVELTQGAFDGVQTADTVTLRWGAGLGGEILAVVPVPTALLSDGTDYEVRVEAVGNRHKVFIDGALVIDFTETALGRTTSGSVGFGGWFGNWLVDDFLVESLGLEGDLNGDGFVGVDDLNIVLVNWNQNVTPGDKLAGDPTGEGFVGVDDLNFVLVNWNNGTPPTGGASIPEPASLAFFAVAGSLIFARRSRTTL